MRYCQIQRNFRDSEYLCKLGKKYLNTLLCKFYTFFLDKICKILIYTRLSTTNYRKVINIQKWSNFLAHPVYLASGGFVPRPPSGLRPWTPSPRPPVPLPDFKAWLRHCCINREFIIKLLTTVTRDYRWYCQSHTVSQWGNRKTTIRPSRNKQLYK